MPYGPIFRRSIEYEKSLALAENDGNFEGKMTFSNEVISDLNWWVTHLPLSVAPMHRRAPDYTVETDASNLGWGANFNGHTTGGQ